MADADRTLLLVGLAMSGTGFTRVLAALANGLSGSYAVYWFGLGGQKGDEVSVTGVASHYCRSKPHTSIALASFRDVVLRIEPDIVLLLGQPTWLAPLLRELRATRPSCTVILYAPIEGTVTNTDWLKPLVLVDDCVLYTEYARQNLITLHASQDETARSVPLPRLHVLPHGVDTACFHPVATLGARSSAGASRTESRRKLFPDRPELAEAFIALNANFPYPRKRIDLTIRGFAAFAQASAPNAYLYLHHVRIDRYLRQQIERIAAEVGLGDRLLFNTLNPRGETISDERLNLLYNACDVGLTTAMGEAWGLASFEHGATGAAQIVPDHTSFRENWGGVAEFIPITGRQHLFYEYADMHTVEPVEVARALQRLYCDRALLRRKGHAALERATSCRYHWPIIARRLHKIIRTALT